MSDINRRAFLATGALGLLARLAPAQQTSELRITVVHGGQPDGFSDGIAFGLDEASRSAQLFGRVIALNRHRVTAPAQAPIVISTLDDAEALAECARSTRGAILNVACSSDRARSAPCAENVFHLVPSQSAIQRVMGGVRPAPASSARIELWHHALERYGAAQLNERFTRAQHRPMMSRDWAAWMALKITVDTWLRSGSQSPFAFVAALRNAGLRFDGHKGVPLHFRTGDHELRQPLYLVTGESPRDLLPTDDEAGGGCTGGRP